MLYTKMTKKAIRLMYEKHKDQVDKAGMPYILHPLTVAEYQNDEDSTIVALLHDIVEDTDVTFEDLAKMGFSENVIAALKCLTHEDGVEYYQYIQNIATNDIATRVKIADLTHNSDLNRLDNITANDIERTKKYIICLEYLKEIMRKKESIKNEKDTILSAIMGFVVGDALGVPAEFKDRSYLDKHKITEMIGYGSHSVPEGTWSDDSSMVLATMDSFIKKETIDFNDIMDRFVDWFINENYTATDKLFDIGITTRNSINSYMYGTPVDKCGETNIDSNGNGSLMRILPLALILPKLNLTEEEQVEIINAISALTHGHEISFIGCKLYCDYVSLLLNGIPKKEAYKQLQEKDYSKFYKKENLQYYDRILKNDISELDSKAIKSSGFVVHTLEAALWSILRNNQYEDSIITSVNLGDDTDTVGAVTGGLAGIIYGYDNIPERWLNKIKKYTYIVDLCKKFKEVNIKYQSVKNK